MCYDYTTSKNVFIIGMISSVILFLTDTKNRYPSYSPKILGLMFMFVAIMQYYDSIFWSNPPIDSKKSNKNAKFTKIAAITNNIQPIILGLIIYYYKGYISDFSKTLLILYSVVSFIYMNNDWDSIKYTQVIPESRPNLHWKWNHLEGSTYFYIFYLFLINYLLIKELGGYIGKIAALTITLSFIYTLWKKQDSILSFGSFWCYYAALIPIFFIFIFV